ncbi:MAG: cyclopropane fatty acyl phospholipid synthase [Waddliaceae bacterium]
MLLNLKSIAQRMLESANVKINGPNPWDIQVLDERFYKRLFLAQTLGVGESYMDGWWSCDRLDELSFRIQRHLNQDRFLYVLLNFYQNIGHFFINKQTKLRSLAVAEQHYNLNNSLYHAMLGETMAYTCGYWKQATDLSSAQLAKYDVICRKAQLKSGEKVLELGCGWGGFAKYAAENYGATVDAVNIAREQIHYAQTLCRGLPIRLHTCDYRDVDFYNPHRIQYDKVISIGLCEHVGHKNYGRFLGLVRNQLKEDGLFLLHTIGKNVTTAVTDRWVQKYIFPGGMLPTLKLLSQASEKHFVIEDMHNFGADYDKTLMAWHHNFERAWPNFNDQFDERFYRMWSYYLLGSAGAFRARTMQLWQLILSPKGKLNGYMSLR